MARDLAKLLSSGRLREGDEVFHPIRKPGGGEIIAKVANGGLEIAGKHYPSPSTAARAASGAAANGWIFWRLRRTGQVLDSLRQSQS